MSSAAADLHARIEAVSLAIAHQKRVLRNIESPESELHPLKTIDTRQTKNTAVDVTSRTEDSHALIMGVSSRLKQMVLVKDLETMKSELQIALNSIQDPIAQLPLEISSQILWFCLSDVPEPLPNRLPETFLRVSHAWSTIALATPSLWSAIRVDARRGLDFGKIMDVWFTRAGTRPLSVSLRGTVDTLHPDIRDLLHENVPQVQTLELYLQPTDLAQIHAPFPSLKRLTIGRANTPGYSIFHDVGVCIAVLHAAPALREYIIEGYYLSADPPLLSSPSASHSHTALRHLWLTRDRAGDDADSSADLLRHIALPALESLWISAFDITPDDFLDFLARSSSPPLQALRIHISRHAHSASAAAAWSPSSVERLCRTVPTLTSLAIRFAPRLKATAEHFPILEVLSSASPNEISSSGSPNELEPGLLPNLRTLSLRAALGNLDPAGYSGLVRLLTARRSRLRTFRLEIHAPPKTKIQAPSKNKNRRRATVASRGSSNDASSTSSQTSSGRSSDDVSGHGPDAGTIAALRELVADGMDIHIGPEQHNYI
ncbi:hypothetical protein C8R43DRAFT_36920 [Mycena crocata]|nr:hypothetical protein C8R43DRAFT_36920 [Mycena crocata]